jgi:hypothetical protein
MPHRSILLIQGAWVTPDCWSPFRQVCEARGHDCIAPAWPLLDRPLAELRYQPDPHLAQTTIQSLVDHFDTHVRRMPAPPA